MNRKQFEDWRRIFLAQTDSVKIRGRIRDIIHRPTGLADLYRTNPECYKIEEDI